MSKQDTKAAGTVTKGVQMSDDALRALFTAAEGRSISLERTVYKAENRVPVIGRVVGIEVITLERADNPEWTVFLFETTHPTKSLNSAGDVIQNQIGDRVIVTANHQIQSEVLRFALDPKEVHTIGLLPKEKIGIGSGKTMWTFEMKILKSEPRTGMYPVPALPGTGPVALLGAGGRGMTADGSLYDPKTGEVTAPSSAVAQA